MKRSFELSIGRIDLTNPNNAFYNVGLNFFLNCEGEVLLNF